MTGAPVDARTDIPEAAASSDARVPEGVAGTDSPDSSSSASDTAAASPAPPAQPAPFGPRLAGAMFGASLAVCLIAYLAFAVPGRWFASVSDKAYGPRQLMMSRGTATIKGDELIVVRPADDGNTVISVTTDLRSADFPMIAWIAAGVPANAKIALLWRTDVEPSRLNTRAIGVESGRLAPIDLHGDPHWLGHVVGLALAVQGPLAEPLRVRGVVAKPADALETLRDRAREWTAFEPWTGASINTIAGGADIQRLPLPVLLAAAIALTAMLLAIIAGKRVRAVIPAIAATTALVALGGWLVLDARWIVNLTRQVRATAVQFAGKDSHDKHLAAEDGELFAFVDKARALLPKDPARIFVVADADFFRGRTAYHLYPQNVWYAPYQNVVPPADRLHAGDWIVVYQRRGVQYDAARRSLRWDGGATVPAELKLLDHGGALFLVQ